MTRRRLILGGALLLALLIGIGIGGSGKKKAASSTKTVTIAQTTTITTAAKAKTVSIVKTKVPKGCTEAITDAKGAYTIAGDAFSVFGKVNTLAVKAITAAGDQDGATLDTLAPEIKTYNSQLDTDETQLAEQLAAFKSDAANCK